MDNIELLREEQNLHKTLNILNLEILNYIEKRKGVAQYIIENRKKVLEDHKDDEDNVIDFFDHERYLREQAYSTIDKKLSEFTKLKDSPYFGKVNFTDEGDEEEIYVGRYGLTAEESYEASVIDWRAPVASLFYKGITGETSYQSPTGEIPVDITQRRQLMVKKGVLEGYFDSDVDVKDEILQMILSSNAGEKLKDIVMSIQKEQDEIIREERNKVVVVNGVAGSGKTTIALHRVAYLLYNFREQLTDKVLILGPNDIFMDYISDILPTLGESGIDQQTFIGFAYKQIGLNEHVIDFPNYLEDVLNSNEEVINTIKYKSSKEFVDMLDNKIAEYEESYFKFEPIIFMGEEVVSVDEIDELFNKHYKYMPLFRRSQKVKLVVTSKVKDKRDEKVREINAAVKAKLESLTPEELLIEENNIEFERKIKIRDIVREVMNTKAQIEKWISNEDIVSMYKDFMCMQELTYLDLPAILYLMIKLDGKKVRQDIKHIVIDEAQDYSYLQFTVLKELTGCKSFTIVGDANQRLVKVEEIPAMLKLKEIFGGFVKEYNLNKSYRSTYQIMEYASNILDEKAIVPFVRKGEYDVIETTIPAEDKAGFIDVILELLDEYEADKYENVAIITTGKAQLQRIAPRIKAYRKILAFDKEDMIYRGGRVLLPSYYAKGLEFDAVIIVDFDDNKNNLIKYIMATRALHRLSVINVVDYSEM